MGSSVRSFGGRFWALVGATFLGFLGMGTVLPLMGPHVRHELGASDQSVGLVIGIFSFVALAGRLISGPLADRRGRKFAFLTGLASCALAGLAYLLPFGLPGAYCGRVLQGFGEACLYTGAAAWAVELAGIERSGQTLGYLSSGIWGGISAGPVVGQWLGSFGRAAAMQTIAASVAFGVLLLIPEDYRPVPHAPRKPILRKSLFMPGIAIGLVNVLYPVVTGFLVLHLASHGNSGRAAFTAFAILVLVSRFFLGGLPDRIHPAFTFYGGTALMAVALCALAGGPARNVAIGSAALLGFGFSFPWAAIGSTVLRRTPPSERGSAVSMLSAFYDLFVGTSSFVAGAVAKHYGYAATFLMAAAALVLAAIAGKWVFAGVGPVTEYAEDGADGLCLAADTPCVGADS
jgi:MFS family permease